MPAVLTKATLTKLQTTGLSRCVLLSLNIDRSFRCLAPISEKAYKVDQDTRGISSNYSTSDSSHASSAPSTSGTSYGIASIYNRINYPHSGSHTISPSPTRALNTVRSPARHSPTGDTPTTDHGSTECPNVVIRQMSRYAVHSHG